MRSLLTPLFLASLVLAALGLAVGCSSGPGPSHAAAAPRETLPDCEVTNGYPPCAYNGGPVANGGPYDEVGGDYYPAYGDPYYPGTGVVVVPEPVLVPVPAAPPPPVHRPPPIKKPPPPRHRRPIVNPCHPAPGRPCP